MKKGREECGQKQGRGEERQKERKKLEGVKE